MPWLLFLFSLVYLLAFFPFAYFRHDDWLILGNAVFHLPGNWKFALSPRLFFSETEVPWFFRPIFKVLVYLFYEVFGFHYSLWLVAMLGVLIAATFLAMGAVEALTQSKERARFFGVLLFASFQIHFGSLIWMGEGMMNCPQLFLLALTTYWFCRGAIEKRFLMQGAAILAYALSLGAKESSIFHPLLLLLLVYFHMPRRPLSRILLMLLPYFLLTAAYLGVRFFAMPLNPSYFTGAPVSAFVKSGVLLIGSPLLCIVAWVIALKGPRSLPLKAFFKSVVTHWPYLLFLGLIMGPYFGHQFFSPGWLLTAGFYFVFIFSLLVPLSPRFSVLKLGLVTLTLSLVPLVFVLLHEGWWQWGRASQDLQAKFESFPSDTREIVVEECANPSYPRARMDRVVGYQDGFYFLWKLVKGTPAKISVVECGTPTVPTPQVVRLRWAFPNFTELH